MIIRGRLLGLALSGTQVFHIQMVRKTKHLLFIEGNESCVTITSFDRLARCYRLTNCLYNFTS